MSKKTLTRKALVCSLKAKLITKDGKYVATLDLEPNVRAPVMLAYQGRTFHVDDMLIDEMVQYREFTKEDLDRKRPPKTGYES